SKIKKLSETTRDGTSLLYLKLAAEKVGFKSLGVRTTLDQIEKVNRPCIILWNQNHFVVFIKVKGDSVQIADPAIGIITYSKSEFIKNWSSNQNKTISNSTGIVLFLEPTIKLKEFTSKSDKEKSLFSISYYLLRHKKLFIQLLYGLLAVMLIQIIMPFLTQSVID
ncbi:cysteine peptidase family C39 domain-containing protein, partial [Xanthovirga aplysinae]|uniref:cysteine peptidase family C39 domain-containing protein n=1 Tax=Xanthovirga aplysinae TaxID=2529853 RepID=UPI001FE9484A